MIFIDKRHTKSKETKTVIFIEEANRKIILENYIDENEISLRESYLNWIYCLCRPKGHFSKLFVNISVSDARTLMWMSIAHLKNNLIWNAPAVQSIKLLALIDIIKNNAGRTIKIKLSDAHLIHALSNYCCRKKIPITIEKFYFMNTPLLTTFATIREIRPFHVLRALSYLAYVGVQITSTLLTKKIECKSLKQSVLFVDIFTYCKPGRENGDPFESQYWGSLPQNLASNKIGTTWLHLFYRQQNRKTYASAIDETISLNSPHQAHVLLEKNISFTILYYIFKDYLKLLHNSFKHSKNTFVFIDDDRGLWGLHKSKFLDSSIGKEALSSLAKLHLFDKFFDKPEKFKAGFFAAEFQPWEFALIYTWKKFKHGKIFAVPHTTCRFWDLRYQISDYLEKDNVNPDNKLLDGICVNGDNARLAFERICNDRELLKNVEALRFEHLNNSSKARATTNSSRRHIRRVLFCGDFKPETTQKIIAMARASKTSSKTKNFMVFKPHPSSTESINTLRKTQLFNEITTGLIEDILDKFEVVVCSAISSVALDAAFSGKQIIQIKGDDELDYSSLRGFVSQKSFSSPSEAAQFLNSKKTTNLQLPSTYFYLNNFPAKWLELIKNNVN